MDSQTASQHARFSPIALAIVLLVLLATLAIHADAAEEDVRPVRNEMRQTTEERRVLFEENQAERALWRASSSAEVRAAFEDQRTELRIRVEERRSEANGRSEEVRARLAEKAQERLGTFVTRMTERMEAILEHLQTVADRVESRITKIEEVVGTELVDARVSLEEARERIDDARADVAYLADLTPEALASDEPKARMEEVREAAKIAKESIVAVHQALRNAVVEIKASASTNSEEENERGGEDAENTEE